MTVGELRVALREYNESEEITPKLMENPALLDTVDNILLTGPPYLLYLEINGTRIQLN